MIWCRQKYYKQSINEYQLHLQEPDSTRVILYRVYGTLTTMVNVASTVS